MQNWAKTLNDEELRDLTRAYLERQAKEWARLKRQFCEKACLKNHLEMNEIIFGIIPYLTNFYESYLLGLIDETIFEHKLKIAVQIFLKDLYPERDEPSERGPATVILSLYVFSIFMPESQADLQKIVSDAIMLAGTKLRPPASIFQNDELYLMLIQICEKPETFRKKLQKMMAPMSPKRAAEIFSGAIQEMKNGSAGRIAVTQTEEELNAKMQCAFSLINQNMAWPQTINQRILEVFYPRR